MEQVKDKELKVFGGVLLELMAKRGITSLAALQRFLKETRNYQTSVGSLSNWTRGIYPVPPDFAEAIYYGFEFDRPENEKDRDRFALAYAFGQHTPMKNPRAA